MQPTMQKISRDTPVTQIGQKVEFIGIIVSGKLIERRSGTHILDRCFPGALIDLDACFSRPGISHVELIAEKDCRLLRFTVLPLLNDERYSERIKDAIIPILANRTVRAALKMDILLASTLREKAMTFFLSMCDKYQSDIFQSNMNQAQMAEFFGVNRSALSRELNKMQREGLIDILPNRQYRIIKWQSKT